MDQFTAFIEVMYIKKSNPVNNFRFWFYKKNL